MWFVFAGMAALTLAHTTPFPFLLEYIGPGRAMWRGAHDPTTPAVYLTYDDGPNPDATPALLDVLAREGVAATFFVIPEHVTPDTAPIVRRAAHDGHGVALHSHTRALMLLPPPELAERLERDAERIEQLTGVRPCRLFRPHAGWRGGQMYEGLDRAGYTLAGWSLFMWDFNWWRPVRPGRQALRLAARATDGSIIVMHDGHHTNPRAARRHTVDATEQLIPRLRQRGLTSRSLCAPTFTNPDIHAPAPEVNLNHEHAGPLDEGHPTTQNTRAVDLAPR